MFWWADRLRALVLAVRGPNRGSTAGVLGGAAVRLRILERPGVCPRQRHVQPALLRQGKAGGQGGAGRGDPRGECVRPAAIAIAAASLTVAAARTAASLTAGRADPPGMARP